MIYEHKFDVALSLLRGNFTCCFSLSLFAQVLTTSELRRAYARPETIPFPPENAYTAERELLGRTLFFDPRLSGSNLLSCASCHNPSFGWGDGQALGQGHGMLQLARRSPTILNVAWGASYFWDGRAQTLEAQARGPIGNEAEMNMPLEELPGCLRTAIKGSGFGVRDDGLGMHLQAVRPFTDQPNTQNISDREAFSGS